MLESSADMQLASAPVAFRVDDVDYLEVEGRTFQARVYQPEGAGPFPALLDVHGGQWTIATSGRLGQAPVDQALAAMGIVVVAIDFRQDPQHCYPDSVADVNYALRWLRANAGRFGGSSQAMGALGSSSGGHLVMLNAMRPADPRYAALPLAGVAAEAARPDYIITCYPILDPLDRRGFAERTGREDIVKATNTYFSPPETIEDANPKLILDRHEQVELPPTLLIQGTADKNVDHQSQDRFAAGYRAAGGDLQLEKLQDAPHLFATTAGPHADRAYGLMKDFISRQLPSE
jgi:acetyl esterase